MTMHVNLSAEMEGFIKSKVASGFYSNATEVIRDAIRRIQADEIRISAWKSAIEHTRLPVNVVAAPGIKSTSILALTLPHSLRWHFVRCGNRCAG